jgi:hypothetical protein
MVDYIQYAIENSNCSPKHTQAKMMFAKNQQDQRPSRRYQKNVY